ncbi:hypothetical protein KUTeg_010890 [Tegillarca granosa]|uniref:Uncharacterized protein n=1 Tax=Tegillarca granosa TaxID=220873 RepID=A0ABQ9F7I7_TEGGR|nr:hypothetical protein KUTeg_010890 [Tegillarca granosa]
MILEQCLSTIGEFEKLICLNSKISLKTFLCINSIGLKIRIFKTKILLEFCGFDLWLSWKPLHKLWLSWKPLALMMIYINYWKADVIPVFKFLNQTDFYLEKHNAYSTSFVFKSSNCNSNQI